MNELLTDQDLNELGWVLDREIDERKVYKKDNYWLGFHQSEYYSHMWIIAIDLARVDWLPDPENFRVIIKIPTKEQLKTITELL